MNQDLVLAIVCLYFSVSSLLSASGYYYVEKRWIARIWIFISMLNLNASIMCFTAYFKQ